MVQNRWDTTLSIGLHLFLPSIKKLWLTKVLTLPEKQYMLGTSCPLPQQNFSNHSNPEAGNKFSYIGLCNSIRLTITEMFQNALKNLNHHSLIMESCPNLAYNYSITFCEDNIWRDFPMQWKKSINRMLKLCASGSCINEYF